MITHGHTLCSKLLLSQVVSTIKEHAFTTSDYPVILSIEMHCSVPFQIKMAKIFQEILGPDIVTCLDENTLPTPADLKRKFIIKGNKLSESPAEEDSEAKDKYADQDDKDDAEKEQEKDVPSTIDQDWSNLVALPTLKFRGFSLPGKADQISSFSESKIDTLAKKDLLAFVNYNKKQLSRVYPSGTRVDSSNYDPSLAWATGCQVVALNFQTCSDGLQINRGRFLENGNSGYVLKPPRMWDAAPPEPPPPSASRSPSRSSPARAFRLSVQPTFSIRKCRCSCMG